MVKDEVNLQSSDACHASDLLALTLDLDQTRPLPGTTESDLPGFLGRFRWWASTIDSAFTDDDTDDLELRYRYWSCCS